MADGLNEQPKWLTDIQNHSWNPELLISGLSIVFIFSISDEINNYGITLIQNYGLNPILVFFAAIYVALTFIALKWTFSIHLLLRGVWVSLVGLNYVFPGGINFEKLPKINRQPYVKDDLGDPVGRILTMEKICSSIFGIAFTIVGLSAYIVTFFLIAFLFDYFDISYIITLFVILGFMIFSSIVNPLDYYLSRTLKKSYIPFLARCYKFLAKVFRPFFFRESLLTYQSNLKPIVFLPFLGSLIFLFALQSGASIAPIARFTSEIVPKLSFLPSSKFERSEILRFENNSYQDRLEKGIVYKSSIPSFNVEGDFLELFIVDYDWDQMTFENLELNEGNSYFTIDTLIDVYLNDSLQSLQPWRKTSNQITGQTGWINFIDLDGIENGQCNLKIDKIVWNFEKREPELYKGWIVIPFWKN